MENNILKSNILKKSLFLFASILVFALAIFSTPLKIYADDNSEFVKASIVLSYSETETQYSIYAYLNIYDEAMPMSISEIREDCDGYFVYNVNDVDIVSNTYEEGGLTLEKGDKDYTIIVKYLPITEGDFLPLTSETLLLSGNAEGGENSEEGLSTLARVLQTALPILLFLTVVAIIVIWFVKKKLTPMQTIAKNLDTITNSYAQIKNYLNNPELLEKLKGKEYGKYLSKTKYCIGKTITIVIPLNIESMGLYNSLLASLLQVEKIIEAEIRVQNVASIEEKITYLNKFQYYILPKLYTNMNEIKKVLKRIKNNSSSTFIQHARAGNAFKNEEESKEFLEKTIYNNSINPHSDPLIKAGISRKVQSNIKKQKGVAVIKKKV